MDGNTLLSELLDLLQDCGVTVRVMPPAADGEHGGGSLVRLRHKEVFFLNEAAPVAEQVRALAAALRGRAELQDRFLPPELREALDAAEG